MGKGVQVPKPEGADRRDAESEAPSCDAEGVDGVKNGVPQPTRKSGGAS